MTRQPWWPPRRTLRYDEPWQTKEVEDAYEEMDAAWRERIADAPRKLQDGEWKMPLEIHSGPAYLAWVIAQLLKEEDDD